MQLPPEIIELIWPPSIANSLVAASSIATAFATVFLWRVTKKLYNATRLMADAMSRAQVVAAIRPNIWSLLHADIHVTNTGNAAAFDIKVEFDPPIERTGRLEGRPMPLAAVSMLRPGDSLHCALAQMSAVLGKTFSVTTSWKAAPTDDRRQSLTYTMDMRDFDGWRTVGPADPMIQLADQVKKLREDWHGVATGGRRLRVDAYSSKDREHEDRELNDWFDKCVEEDRINKGPRDLGASSDSEPHG